MLNALVVKPVRIRPAPFANPLRSRLRATAGTYAAKAESILRRSIDACLAAGRRRI